MLRRAFHDLAAAGFPTAKLDVDGENATGALGLYERAGMVIETEYVCYEKEYRPGREPDEA